MPYFHAADRKYPWRSLLSLVCSSACVPALHSDVYHMLPIRYCLACCVVFFFAPLAFFFGSAGLFDVLVTDFSLGIYLA